MNQEIDEFAKHINRLTLFFSDASTEDAYHANISALTSFNSHLMKVIIIGYAIIMMFTFGYFMVWLYIDDACSSASNLLVIILIDIVIMLVEVLFFSYTGRLKKFRGILATITSFVSYQFFLTIVNTGVYTPMGDFGIVAILVMNGMALCHSWLMATLSYMITYTFAVIYAYAGDAHRSSICSTIAIGRPRVELLVNMSGADSFHQHLLRQ
ncbi:MAG: hypothetical protein P4M11_06750 [Candidatus Pacebacteria bacterium]|nr:hypothetical protein [Candidatus Paceibacterota bacterium]